ncbi:MAG: class II aldolase/adducin family protein [Deltaproteobacteria bacterium]
MSQFDQEKKAVLEACLWLSGQGYFGSQRGSGGNISVRLPDGAMAITPTSVQYQDLSAHDICVVGPDHQQIPVPGCLKPSIEAGLHSIIYRNRPDVQAVVHTHQIYGSVFGVINTPIPALFDEVSYALGPVIDIIPYAISGSPELAAHVGGKLSNNANAYIIQNHGILALGKNLDKAILHAELLEKLAHTYYLALATGRPVTTLPQATVDFAQGLRNADVQEAVKKL